MRKFEILYASIGALQLSYGWHLLTQHHENLRGYIFIYVGAISILVAVIELLERLDRKS